MTDRDDEFCKRLLVTFSAEAQEHLQGMYSLLLRLEQGEAGPEEPVELVESIFREAHSLKGAARSVNLVEIEAFCQALEGVFSALKKHELATSDGLFDLLREGLDFLCHLLPTAGGERARGDKGLQRKFIGRFEEFVKINKAGKSVSGELLTTEDAPRQSAPLSDDSGLPVHDSSPDPGRMKSTPQRNAVVPGSTDSVRVSTSRLSSVLLQSEEMLSARLAAAQRVVDMRSTASACAAWKKEWNRIRPAVENLRYSAVRQNQSLPECRTSGDRQALDRLLDFLEWNSTFMATLSSRYLCETATAERDSRALNGMVTTLLDDMKKVMMFPFSSLLEFMPSMVRDMARECGKNVEVSLSGENIEIDRRILEEMKDPLLHLVRNCIDHGIETPSERTALGKPRYGTVRIAICPLDDKVELTVADDGRGISREGIRSALLKLGTRAGDDAAGLAGPELLAQIFESGVSTSPVITEISGRGLGLAIVREKVEKTGGTVTIESTPGSGSTFRIVLPLTVATLRGITVRLGGFQFVLPSMYVTRVLRVNAEQIQTIENVRTISLGGETVSLAYLADVLELPAAQAGSDAGGLLPLVLLVASGTCIAFQVDEIMGEQEVLQKGLGRLLSRVRNVAGAAVLGNGQAVPVLNVIDLLKSAVRLAGAANREIRDENAGISPQQRHSVLVVEDSITTRILLTNILESAGYLVSTAVDGRDACTRLKNERFDIVVSDVEMPHMNGFELTAWIRSDKALTGLPVVLVTALASRDDQERGIDAGADAYIVKSGFDQSNLLDIMKRLL